MVIDKVEKSIDIANYIINTKKTIRETGVHFNISKSTVYTLISTTLKNVNPELYESVHEVLLEHKKDAPHRGGVAAKKKRQERKYQGMRDRF